jgi:hypothetical protein
MATTKAILLAAADRLKSQVPGVAVELYPENPAAWRMNHPRAALLVDYRGSRYGEVVDTGIVAQGRELSIGISVVARTLHDAYGALAITDAVRLRSWGSACRTAESCGFPPSALCRRRRATGFKSWCFLRRVWPLRMPRAIAGRRSPEWWLITVLKRRSWNEVQVQRPGIGRDAGRRHRGAVVAWA